MLTRTLSYLNDFDRRSMLWIRERRANFFIPPLRVFTYSGAGPAWITYALILNPLQALGIELIPRQTEYWRATICPLIAWMIGRELKKRVARKRPYDQLEGYKAAVYTPNCGSFPSSHAASTVALASALIFLHHPWAPGISLWAALVVFSRFYLGVHFPTDLLGGVVLGVLCGALIFPIQVLFGSPI